jgi:hypothetical protein
VRLRDKKCGFRGPELSKFPVKFPVSREFGQRKVSARLPPPPPSLDCMSKLFRNVPIVNSLEMSPFHVADGPYGFGVFLVLELIVGMRTGAKPCS